MDTAAREAIKTRPHGAPISEYLVAGRRVNRTRLKGRLLAEGLKENRCECCRITDWRGAPLAMALHHANGDGLDNRIENLVMLCPNATPRRRTSRAATAGLPGAWSRCA